MKIILIIISVVSVALSPLEFNSTSGSRRESPWLIFEGTVVKVGKAPPAVCGVLSPYRLAEYHVDRIFEGSYSKSEIVVDHLFCKMDMFEDIKTGDKVIVVIDLQQRPSEVWNDEEVRRKNAPPKRFYLAKSVYRATSCCDF